jgi:hypothetical protein
VQIFAVLSQRLISGVVAVVFQGFLQKSECLNVVFDSEFVWMCGDLSLSPVANQNPIQKPFFTSAACRQSMQL